jgi:hypothetical protein
MLRGLGELCLRLDVDVNPASHEVLNEITPASGSANYIFLTQRPSERRDIAPQSAPKATIHAPPTKHHELYFVLV